MDAVGKSMQDSWIDVPEDEKEKTRGSEGGGGGGDEKTTGISEVVGSLTHSRSQQEMEQLLASAASDDEGSDENPISVPSFTIPEGHLEHSVHQVTSRVGEMDEGLRQSISSEISTLQGISWLFHGGVANLLVPVLVLTHLALFGLGFYIGRRTNLVKTL